MSVMPALERIKRWAEQHDPEFVALLQPGLSRQEIGALVGDLPFALAEEVYELYQWHNGQKAGEFKLGLQQTRFYPFMPLQEALYEYTRFQAENFQLEVEADDCDFAESGGWFPLFGMERYYTATLGQSAGEQASPLVGVTRDDKTHFRYPSLKAMLEFRADLYEAGAMRQDTEGWQWADYGIASVIQRRHFPGQVSKAEADYMRLGEPDTPLTRGYYDLEAQRSDAVCRLVSSGSELALPVVAEYLRVRIGNQPQADSVLRDLLAHPNKIRTEWPWTRNRYIGGLAAHFEVD